MVEKSEQNCEVRHGLEGWGRALDQRYKPGRYRFMGVMSDPWQCHPSLCLGQDKETSKEMGKESSGGRRKRMFQVGKNASLLRGQGR